MDDGPERWAREHVKVTATPVGRSAFRYLARIEVDGLLFEERAEGDVRPGQGLERRATDAAVAAYLDFIERSGR